MAHGVTPITGIPAGGIVGICPSVQPGSTIQSSDVNDALQAIENDLASVGSVTTLFLPSPDPWAETYAGGSGFQDTTFAHLDFATCKVGAVIIVWFSCQVDVVGSGQIRIATRDDFAGANVLASSITQTWTSNTTAQPVTLFARHVVTNAGTTRVVVQLGSAGISLGGVGALLAQRVQTL
jgi:hypothetical protein